MKNIQYSSYIKAYFHIKDGAIYKNNQCLFSTEHKTFKNFAKEAYSFLKIDYGKFFKMDDLSKLAFLAAELALNESTEKNTALIFANRASSLPTDRKHQESIQDNDNFYPSPANFVYTLPNICLGEICIRHSLYSENSFFIFEQFNPTFFMDYTESMFIDKKANEALCAWVNVDNETYEAFIYLVGKEGEFPHTNEILTKIQ